MNLLREAREHTADFSADEISSVLRSPVIIISAPRSGSNLLFEQLGRIAGFWTVGGESHVIFLSMPNLRAENAAYDSGALGRRHADLQTSERFRACCLYLLRDHEGRAYLQFPDGGRPTHPCLLEKTPRNTLNIPFLCEVFPDARFIFLHRDARQVVASLIEAWTVGLQTGRFVTFTDLPGWDRPGWCFLLPPGWRELRGKSLAEIAAFQWSVSNQIVLDDLAVIPDERWTSVNYDSLVANPQPEFMRLCRFAGVDADNIPASPLPLSRTTLTPPHPDKWQQYEHEIVPLLPVLDAVSDRIAAATENRC